MFIIVLELFGDCSIGFTIGSWPFISWPRDGSWAQINDGCRLELWELSIAVLRVKEGVFGLLFSILQSCKCGQIVLMNFLLFFNHDGIVEMSAFEFAPSSHYLGPKTLRHFAMLKTIIILKCQKDYLSSLSQTFLKPRMNCLVMIQLRYDSIILNQLFQEFH